MSHSNSEGDNKYRGILNDSSREGIGERPTAGMDAQIEYILKIPRSLDHRMAEELNERHRMFVEEEIKRFTLALSNAEGLSSECRPASRRSLEDDQDSV